jgi:hypothetical protein
MLKKSRLFIYSLVLTIGLAGFSVPAYAATASYSSSSAICGTEPRCHMRGHHDFGGMKLLSEISGKSVAEIESIYPQKTSWQAAKAMGKLDVLKKSYLTRARMSIDKLVQDKKVSAQDGTKMYADIEKRVAAIDGVDIVITGKPNFKPQFQSSGSR